MDEHHIWAIMDQCDTKIDLIKYMISDVTLYPLFF